MIERDTLLIQPPTRAEILALLPAAMQSSANNEILQTKRASEPAIDSTIDKGHTDALKETSASPATFVRNIANTPMKCYGDVVIKGTLLLNNVVIETNTEGCRLYVTDTVVIQGVIKYQDLTGAKLNAGMLQIASGRAILLGIGLRRGGINWQKTESPSPLRRICNSTVCETNIANFDDGLTRNSNELPGGGWVRFSGDRINQYGMTAVEADAFAVDMRKIGGELVDAGEHSTFCAKTSGACNTTGTLSSGTKTVQANRSEAYLATLPSDPGNDTARLALDAYNVNGRAAITTAGC